MDSFIFNTYKNYLLKGGLDDKDVWTFHLVNKSFGEDLKDILPKLGTLADVERYVFVNDPTIARKGMALNKYTSHAQAVKYTYKVSTSTVQAERPTYVDMDNWDEFNEKYPNQPHLYAIFFDENSSFRRLYDTGEVDPETTLPIMKARGFYYVETAEELKWCADKVNGIIGGSKSPVYNNFINIVLGDNLGYGKAEENSYKHIDFSIGMYVDRPYEGIFYGNGYIIENIALECNANSSGIIGYLGTSGIISTIRIKGHNLLKCNKKISIDHMTDDACDVNAGFLCGKNNGLISDVLFQGSVTITDFIPGAYPVRNKTDDDGNAFDNPDANRYYPDYLCINSMSNIVPYIGYFGEGVFGSLAMSGINRGYWKSNGMYAGDISVVGDAATVNYFYPYDNSSCAEWAYPSAANNKDLYEVTGHTLFYNINAMFDTNALLADKQGDWCSELSMFKVSSTPSGDPDAGTRIFNYEISATQYLDRAVKMHQFNRVSYNTGLLIGCNEGNVANIAMNASAYTSGTYVGFLGGIAGKQAADYKTINNVCVNLTAADISEKRQRYISDDGDMITSFGNDTGTFTLVSDNIAGNCFWENHGGGYNVLNLDFFNTTAMAPQKYYKYYNKFGGTLGDGTWDWGDTSVIRLNLNGCKEIVDGSMTHVFTMSQSAYKHVMYRYGMIGAPANNPLTDKSYSSYSAYYIPDINENTKFMPGELMLNELLNSSSFSGEVTAVNNTSSYSGLKFSYADELALINFETINQPIGLVDPNCTGIVYLYGNYGHEESLENDFKYVLEASRDYPNGDVGKTLKICELNNIGFVSGINYAGGSQFAVYNMNPQRTYNGGGMNIGSCVSLSGDVNAYKYVDTSGYLISDTKLVSCSIGGFILEYKNEINIPSNKERNYLNMMGIYGNNNYSYNTFNIIGAMDIELTFMREVGGLQPKYEVYTMKIPHILNSEKIGGNYFSNKAANECFIANYEKPDGLKPVVSYMLEHYTFNGCKNYNIELKSIKNIGAMFGSLVLGTEQTMSNISAYLYNTHKTKFDYYVNQRAYDAGRIEDLGQVVNITAFDIQYSGNTGCFFNPANLSAIGNKNGFFDVSGTGIVHVKSMDYSGNTYGYNVDATGFPISAGMRVGLYNRSLMYAYQPFALPDLHDFSFDNRFAPFAAVCEYNSCNISDKYNTTNFVEGAKYPYIHFTNINCIYHESDNDNNDIFPFRYYGPMYLSNKDIQFTEDTGKIEPSYAFGIALPFIAEIKPTYIAIPSILESPLSNIPNYGDTEASAVYKRVGMFTMDQNFAAPTNDPNFWSVNLCVDLPGIAGVINRDETSAQCLSVNGFALDNSETETRGKTTGYLLDHLFDMGQVKINNATYGHYEDDETYGHMVYDGNGYGRFGSQTKYAEVSNTSRLGFAKQSSNDQLVRGGHYTQNKVLAPMMYFGSNNVLWYSQYSGFLPESELCIIDRYRYNPNSVGEFHSHYTPVWSDPAISNSPVLSTEPFKYLKTDTMVTRMSDHVKNNPTNIIYIGVKGNSIKADKADTYGGTDKFKYNFSKKVVDGTFTWFKHRVEIDERNDKYGFWFMDPLNTPNYRGTESKYYNGMNDEVRYDGSTLHLGAMFSEKCLLENLRVDSYITAASGIICDDLDGLYVTDTRGHNVMYINIGMGECDGTQSWSMPCNVSGASGGLILEIE